MTIYLNQRSGDRHRITGGIMYAREKNGDLYNGVLRDCADQGVSFFSPCPYLPGTKLYLKTEKHIDSAVQPAMVAWSKPQRHGANSRLKFRVGVKYTNW